MSSSSNPSPVAGTPAFFFEQLPAEPRVSRPQPVQSRQEQGESIVNAALAEAERIRDVARTEGYEAGRRAAEVEAAEQLESAFAAVGEALAQAREMRARTADDVERHAVELGLQVAEKAIAGALDAQPERVVVLVNPEDLETVRAAAGDLVHSLGGIEHCEVQEERRVDRGGAIVRSSTGEIDARLTTKLDRAREVLATELRG